MTRSLKTSILAIAASALPSIAVAAPPPGIYVASADRGAVYQISGGGDFTFVTPYATGLDFPTGVCTGPGGNMYAAEGTSGEITVVYAGADLTDAQAFASGLDFPASLVCSPTQILVVEYASGEVTDVTSGGSFSGVAPMATGLGAPVGLYRTSAGALYVSTEAPGNVFDITAGGNYSTVPSFVIGSDADAFAGMTVYGGQLLLAATSNVVAFDGGGLVSDLPVVVPDVAFFSLNHFGGRLLGGTASGTVFDVTSGTVPFAWGLRGMIFGMTYAAGCGSGLLDAGEQCDDGNTAPGDGCNESCMREPPPETGGDGGGGSDGAGAADGGDDGSTSTGGAGGAGGNELKGTIEGKVEVDIVCTAAAPGSTARGGWLLLGLAAVLSGRRWRRG